MTLDERIEALVETVKAMAAENKAMAAENKAMAAGQKERIDAVTQSLELLASLHRDNEKQLAEQGKRLADDERRMAMFMDTMNRVARILEAHDLTLDDH